MKIINVIFVSIFGASMLLASDFSAPIEDRDLAQFVADHFRLESSLKDTGEEKVSEVQRKQIGKEMDAFLIKDIEDYVNGISETKDNPKELLDFWFEQVINIGNHRRFSKTDTFFRSWNQALRAKLNIETNGTAWLGYIAELSEPLYLELGLEIRAFLAECKEEKKLGPSNYSASLTEDEIDFEHFELVFDKPVNVRGSHAKYLCRKIGSGLEFKIVRVRPHGLRRAVPKERQERALFKKLETSFERKNMHESDAPKTAIAKPELAKSAAENNAMVMKPWVKEGIRSLHIDAQIKPVIHVYHAENGALGEQYYNLLSIDAKKAVDTGYKSFFKKHKGKMDWLTEANRIKGKYLYCFHVVTEQESQDTSKKLDKNEVRIHHNQTTDANKENACDNAYVDRTELPKSEMEAQRKENAETLLKLLNDPAQDKRAVIRFINKNDIDINRPDSQHSTAILLAATHDDFLVFETIAKKFKGEIDLNSKDAKGNTPLMIAASLGKKKIVEYLLKHNANIKERNHNGQNALWLAAMADQNEITELLLKKARTMGILENYLNERQDEKSYTLLMAAAEKGFDKVVKVLLKFEAKTELTNEYKQTALFLAVIAGQKDAVWELLQKANVNAQDLYGKSILIFALNNSEILDMLLQKGADPNLKDMNQVSAFSLLCMDSFDFDLKLSTFIILSPHLSKEFKLKKTKFLRNRGAIDLLIDEIMDDSFANYDRAALNFDRFLAKYIEKRNVALHLLLAQGADVNVKTPQARTPLQHFSIAGNFEAVKLLFRYGAIDSNDEELNVSAMAEAGKAQISQMYDCCESASQSLNPQKASIDKANSVKKLKAFQDDFHKIIKTYGSRSGL